MLFRLIALSALFVLLVSGNAEAAKRIALLIGNQNYQLGRLDLANPHNDVDAVGAALDSVGFDVRIVKDAGLGKLLRAVKGYAQDLRRAGDDAVGFFYYSGHGAQNAEDRFNYLIPTDVETDDSRDLWPSAVRLKQIIVDLKDRAPNAVHFVVFDACRNELKLSSKRTKSLRQPRGFVPVGGKVRGMLIAYSTAEGELASDAGRGVGPYAKALSKWLTVPDIEAVTVFRKVQLDVFNATGQEPWYKHGVFKSVYLAGRSDPDTVPKRADVVNARPTTAPPSKRPDQGSQVKPPSASCKPAGPAGAYQSCIAALIAGGDQFAVSDQIREAVASRSERIRGIGLRAYLSSRQEFGVKFVPPAAEMRQLAKYLDNPTRRVKHQMLQRRRYLLFLNEANFTHTFSIAAFDFKTGRGELREIGRGRDTPHKFTVTGTRLSFNTPWCLKKLLNCRCRYEMRLAANAKLQGSTICTGYFGFKPLRTVHELQLN